MNSKSKALVAPGTVERIQNAISDMNRNLPELLESGHISNPTLTARATAAAHLIFTTVDSFASLLPQSIPATTNLPRAQRLETAATRNGSLPLEGVEVKVETGRCALSEEIPPSSLGRLSA